MLYLHGQRTDRFGRKQRLRTAKLFEEAYDQNRRRHGRHMVLFLRSGRVEIAVQGSAEFFAAYAGPPPSLVFIDGDHSYEAVRRDIAGAQRIGAAVIGGHDYAPSIPGVVQAVEERFPGATVRRDTAWMWGPLVHAGEGTN